MTIWINNAPYPNVIYTEREIADMLEIAPYTFRHKYAPLVPRHSLLDVTPKGIPLQMYLYNPHEVIKWMEENHDKQEQEEGDNL